MINTLLQVSKKLNIKIEEGQRSQILEGFRVQATPDFESLAVSFSSAVC